MTTVNEIFDEVNRRLADPAKAGTTSASYRFDLSGDDGGSCGWYFSAQAKSSSYTGLPCVRRWSVIVCTSCSLM